MNQQLDKYYIMCGGWGVVTIFGPTMEFLKMLTKNGKIWPGLKLEFS